MKIIPILFLVISLCASCGGPKLFKKPQDFMGGNKAAAVQRDDSIALQMTANEIREAQKRIELLVDKIKK